ncbi:hypothetical protein ANN_01136 [Periplaneta americana]|uniref:Uncharacterized protein n=1 Tax=Periplaneta americana TaxID=6978 RepID=A0ABQ8TVM2_PERAM|nr:hypothetical protein ANN_01136 [Periplaneta americana]
MEGHVARMDESRNAYGVLVGRPEGERLLWRPRRSWEDSIEMDLREFGHDKISGVHTFWRFYERIPNLSAEQSDGITVFRISAMTSLTLHRCRTGSISLQRWWLYPSTTVGESDWFLYRAGISRRMTSCTVVSWSITLWREARLRPVSRVVYAGGPFPWRAFNYIAFCYGAPEIRERKEEVCNTFYTFCAGMASGSDSNEEVAVNNLKRGIYNPSEYKRNKTKVAQSKGLKHTNYACKTVPAKTVVAGMAEESGFETCKILFVVPQCIRFHQTGLRHWVLSGILVANERFVFRESLSFALRFWV